MSFPAGDTKDDGTSEECAVTVSVRLRPLNKRELDGGCVQPAWHWYVRLIDTASVHVPSVQL